MFSGDWECQLVRSGAALSNVQGVVNIRTEVDSLVPDTRLPPHFIPASYTLDLVAVLDNENLIEGAVTIEVKNLKGDNQQISNL